MKAPKNLRIILVPVGRTNRGDLEDIENKQFSSKNQLARTLCQIAGEATSEILTPDEFRKLIVFTKAHRPFNGAMLNIRKRKQCYDLSEFMDEFNNQEFGDDTDKYWMGYVKLR
jgi:hypothetical protein